MLRRLRYSPILAFVMLLECLTASAAEAPLPRRPPPTKAEHDLQEQAKRLVNEGRIADARDTHLTLWRLTGSASDAFNVGMLSFRLRDFETAAEFLTIYFDLVGTPDAPKIWLPPGFKDSYELARANFAEARRHVGALEVRVSERGADVLVDGRQVGASPLERPVFVAPGQHRVSAQLAGAHVEQPVAVEAGGERTVWLVLNTRASVTAAAAHAGPRVSKAGDAPGTAPHRPGTDPVLRWWAVGALAATSAALAVTGSVAVAKANAAADEREQARRRVLAETSGGCPGATAPCGAFTAADGDAKTMTGLAVGAFIGAGLAAAGAGVTGYVFGPKAAVRVGSAPGALVSVSW
ncbi:hypothetical protein SOCE26_076770 [Sorangium cellulosum]|uniref:PEGA domain-containing protein n=1 Tax=Sorangium cellulosum TaxID=56 RepID=A0A2L0F3N8_SORCE|nr:hypothetical protein [Sorangium cellulosum]AUX46172.1 hypothetical protein SOCE26_076770 [Sorangium cellulosum]